MRLREKKISEVISDLVIQASQLGTSPPQFKIVNVIKANKSIHLIEEMNLFNEDISFLKNTAFYKNPYDSFIVSNEDYSQVAVIMTRLHNDAKKLSEALQVALGSESLLGDRTISIKINVIKDFENLINIADKLKKVIQLPLGEYAEGGEIKIEDFDSGTYWMDVLLPTTASVFLIGNIAWAGAVIYKKYQEAFAYKTYVGTLKLHGDLLQTIQKAAKEKIQLDIEAEAKLIQNEFFKSEDLEQLQRLQLSIKEYSKLLKEGVEIQAALTASPNVEKMFPDYKVMELIESKIKHIENIPPTT